MQAALALLRSAQIEAAPVDRKGRPLHLVEQQRGRLRSTV